MMTPLSTADTIYSLGDTCLIPPEKQIFHGSDQPDPNRINNLTEPPPWRTYVTGEGRRKSQTELLGPKHRASPTEITAVNLAMHLRRPLLITGAPGSGKTSLAHAVAHELGLGKVLHWPINSRSTIQDGKFEYDAIGRFQSHPARYDELGQNTVKTPENMKREADEIGQFITLGPLGTALVLSKRKKPKVLLIDELDKGDIDLPNDLLHVFEEGSFTVKPLSRVDKNAKVNVSLYNDEGCVEIEGGWVECEEFPVVFMTSNGEREFPPAFLRRCLRLDIKAPDEKSLHAIVHARLGDALGADKLDALIDKFMAIRGPGGSEGEHLATDQLLNAVLLLSQGVLPDDAMDLENLVLRRLTGI